MAGRDCATHYDQVWPVNRTVGNVKNDGPERLESGAGGSTLKERQKGVQAKRACSRERFAQATSGEVWLMRFFSLVVIGLLGACSGPRLPPPNSVNAQYDARQRAVQVMVSGLQPPTDATLVANDGARYAASGIVLISGPHVLYNPPLEPRRVCRRLFGLSYAAKAVSCN